MTPRTLRIALTAVFTVVAAAAVLAQGTRPRFFDELRQSVAQAQADAVLQIRLRWQTAEPRRDPARTVSRFELLSADTVPGSMRAERAPQVGETSLVVVSLDTDGHELDWRTLADPRVVRAEGTGTERLSGRRLYRTDVVLLLAVPDVPGISRIQIYSVRAANGRALLDLLGTVPVR